MKYLITSLFFLFSSVCLAIQTRQQCKDGLLNASLKGKICANHADHFSGNFASAVGIIIKDRHYLYKDKTQEEYSASGLVQLPENIKFALGSNAESLLNIDAFHASLASASGEHWDTLGTVIRLQGLFYTQNQAIKATTNGEFCRGQLAGKPFSGLTLPPSISRQYNSWIRPPAAQIASKLTGRHLRQFFRPGWQTEN